MPVSFTTIYRAIHGGIMEKIKRKKGTVSYEKIPETQEPTLQKTKKTAAESGFLTSLRSFRKNTGIVLSWAIGKLTASKEKGGNCFIVIVERKSRFTLIEKAVKHSVTDVTPVIEKMLSKIPKEYLKTIISNRGKEITYQSKITSIFQVEFYFAHSSSPWEKPTVENTNSLTRQYFPKRTSFNDIAEERIRVVTDKLNSCPRKILGWLSSKRVFHCCIWLGNSPT